MRRFFLLLSLSLAIPSLCTGAQKQEQRGPSTPEERARFVSIAHQFEANPLDPALAKDREWAIVWLIQVPDIHTKLCTNVLGTAYDKEKYRHAPEVTAQLVLSSGAFIIENPDKSKDDQAQYLAAVEGVLKAYQAILSKEPDATSKALNDLIQKQKDGKLADLVRSSAKKCK
jgi:hypothetical protein